MLWVALLLCEIILEVFGLYDSALGMVFIKNNFDMKIIIVLVLYYNLIINMIDCGLKFIVAVWLLIGPKGQLILKCPFGVIVSTKNQRIFFKDFCPSLLKEVESKKSPMK